MRFYFIELGRLDDICDNPFLPDPFVEESVRYEPAFVVMLEMMMAFLVMIMMMKMIPMMLMLMSSWLSWFLPDAFVEEGVRDVPDGDENYDGGVKQLRRR